jgi:alkylation response protein AidB-like acyl-CoA dehydrogenase
MLSKSGNEDLKKRYLPKMGNGEKLVGIGFSQLRRPGPPIMRASRIDGGYRLDGNVPWITGWSLYPEFLVGATMESGEAVFAIVPLTDQTGIKISPPMRLAAMETAMTVSAEFEGWFVPDGEIAFVKPGNWIANSDMINIALQGHFALGCARAGIDIVEAAAEKRGADFIREAARALNAELADCKTQTLVAQRAVSDDENPSEFLVQRRLEVRAWAIDLAVRCAHAAITASSGAANSLSHPAQRVYREALVYTVSAQTTPIMEATLGRLVRP